MSTAPISLIWPKDALHLKEWTKPLRFFAEYRWRKNCLGFTAHYPPKINRFLALGAQTAPGDPNRTLLLTASLAEPAFHLEIHLITMSYHLLNNISYQQKSLPENFARSGASEPFNPLVDDWAVVGPTYTLRPRTSTSFIVSRISPSTNRRQCSRRNSSDAPSYAFLIPSIRSAPIAPLSIH